MKRFQLPVGRRVLVLLVLLGALVVLFPLRLALAIVGLGGQGITARAVSGSVWSGRIDDLTVANLPLGSVSAGLSPLALLVGEARIGFARPSAARADGGGAAPLAGRIAVSRNSTTLDRFDGTLPTAAALAPLPVASLVASGLSVRFTGGGCERAAGSLRAVLSGSFAGVALSQGLSGTASCDGRFVRIPLASQTGQERIDLRVSIGGDYIADLIAAEPAADRVAALTALGFTAVPGGYRLRVTGRFG